ncbi:MAG: phosphatase PAP2 family protein [Acidobacteriota bacterium]
MIALVGGSLAFGAHSFDADVDEHRPGARTRRILKPGAVAGAAPTLLGIAGLTYVVGASRQQPRAAHLGADLLAAVVVSEGVGQLVKAGARRERPDHSDKKSFPSGHAANSFAFATVLQRRLGWRAGAPAYAFSSYVAASRLSANRHWLSDVVFGSAVGVIAGRAATWHGRALPVTVIPEPRAVHLVVAW